MRSLLFYTALVVSTYSVAAQKKTDLLEDNKSLNALVERNEATIRDLKQQLTRVESLNETYKFETENLKSTNKALMERLSKFANQSVTNIMNIGDQIESMRSLEKQNQQIKGSLIQHDSVLIETLKKFRPVISKAKGMELEPGGLKFPFLVSTNESDAALASDKHLMALDSALATHEFYQVSFETNAKTRPLAERIFTVFTQSFGKEPNRFLFQSSAPSDTLFIKLHPDYEKFYASIRALVK